MIACTASGVRLMRQVQRAWEGIEWICKVKCAALPELCMPESVAQCVGEWFHRVDGIIFFAAAGIAVRSVAPCLTHKGKDPGVVAVDASGRFSISLLSGHMGGGNELAERVAAICGAIPVITTATDREGLFSVDNYARRHGLRVTDWELAKRISAALLEGERIGFCVDEDDKWLDREEYLEDFPPEVRLMHCAGRTDGITQSGVAESGGCEGNGGSEGRPPGFQTGENALPESVTGRDLSGIGAEGGCLLGVCVSGRRSVQPVFPCTLQLVPLRFVVGIGCRKGIPEEQIRHAVEDCLKLLDLRMEAVSAVATIDLKKEEPGLVVFCGNSGLSLLTFSAEELRGLPGRFSESAFVGKVTGVTNVCERSAVAAAGEGARLVCPKQIHDGVTTAVALCAEAGKA